MGYIDGRSQDPVGRLNVLAGKDMLDHRGNQSV